MLQRPEMFILGTPLHYRMYQKLEFTQEVSVQHPTAAYKLTLCVLPQTSYDVLKAGKWLTEVHPLL